MPQLSTFCTRQLCTARADNHNQNPDQIAAHDLSQATATAEHVVSIFTLTIQAVNRLKLPSRTDKVFAHLLSALNDRLSVLRGTENRLLCLGDFQFI